MAFLDGIEAPVRFAMTLTPLRSTVSELMAGTMSREESGSEFLAMRTVPTDIGDWPLARC
jgi:hypothetical protein